MCPVITQFGPFTISGYWFMTVIALSVSIFYIVMTNRSGRVKRIEWYHVFNLCCIAILSIFAGGIVMGVLVNLVEIVQRWSYYQNHMQELVSDLTGSRAFYGGALMLIVLFVWYTRKHHLPSDTLCTMFAPAVPLFMVFGRLGCFMGGCCYGMPVEWGIVFPPEAIAPSGIPLFPSQLIEAGCHLILFFVLIILERHLQQKWMLVSFYVACYAVIRFTLEFWRGDMVRGVWILSSSQWVSIVLLVAVIIHALIWTHRRKRVPV